MLRTQVAKHAHWSDKAIVGQSHFHVFWERSDVDDNAVRQSYTWAKPLSCICRGQ